MPLQNIKTPEKTQQKKTVVSTIVPPQQVIKSIKDILDFGKHVGKTLEEVCKTDPGYVSWLVNRRIIASDNKRSFNKIQKYFSDHLVLQLNIAPIGFEGANSPDENWEDVNYFNHF